jgi:hypothetical protein
MLHNETRKLQAKLRDAIVMSSQNNGIYHKLLN